MANNINPNLVHIAYANRLQDKITETYAWKEFCNEEFADAFNWATTVTFNKLNKLTVSTLASTRATITVSDLVSSSQTFSLDQIKHNAFDVSLEEMVEVTEKWYRSDALDSLWEAYAKAYDIDIFANYADALYTFDDWDLATATNGWTGNPIILSKTSAPDFFTSLNKEFNLNYLPDNDRKLAISPAEEAVIINLLWFERETPEADTMIKNWVIGRILNIKMVRTNNLTEASWTRHGIAAQWDPICFGQNITPKIYTTSIDENTTTFTSLTKSVAKYGTKVFSEWAERMFDVHYKI